MHIVLERAQLYPQLKPTVHMIGLKMYSLELRGSQDRFIVFKDTYHFLMAPLSTLPTTFGLNVEDKGFFPHLFTKRENLERQLSCIPHRRNYQPQFMKVKEKQAFERWYRQQQHPTPFNLRQRLLEYCSNDVRILTEASLKFRELFMAKTGLDVFVAASTCAGLAMNT